MPGAQEIEASGDLKAEWWLKVKKKKFKVSVAFRQTHASEGLQILPLRIKDLV